MGSMISNQHSAKLFVASLPFDRRLYRQDIACSVAHVRMLARQGIITDKEAELIVMGLGAIREELDKGTFPFRPEMEDIHMAIEARLTERLGPVAGKLHTGRSRNDLVATDTRLYVKDAATQTVTAIHDLQSALLDVAQANLDVAIPGYTHLQRAQPVLFAHHMLAYFEMLHRDCARFRAAGAEADVMPLGSGALAGVTYPLDREFLAQELGFSRISDNSLDAVSDRDFLVSYLAAAATCMMHLSRLSEELVLWSSAEFAFISLGEEYTTGSSIMPQKRNPDMAELARGKTGRVYGHLMGLLATMKGLPLAYNRDMQEDKEGVFDTVDTLQATLGVFSGMVRSIRVNREATARAAADSMLLATDVADYLVGKGLPFRQAHGVVAQVVRHAQSQGKALNELSVEELQRFSTLFAPDVTTITLEAALAARRGHGGTAPRRVREALAEARKRLEACRG
ncbi:MAG: argininosuccinate lyase [Chloroflexi bacterium]|nr:argininosuccinate lyase [Chloroflexota bacterium]